MLMTGCVTVPHLPWQHAVFKCTTPEITRELGQVYQSGTPAIISIYWKVRVGVVAYTLRSDDASKNAPCHHS